jgi:hypothetical protein
MTLIRTVHCRIDWSQMKKTCPPAGAGTAFSTREVGVVFGATVAPGVPAACRRLTHATASTAATAAATPIPTRHRFDSDSDRRGSRLGSRP